MSQSQRSRTVPITEDKLTARSYSPGEDGIVLTTQVPNSQVWGVPVGEPVTVALVQKQTFSVNEGSAGQVIDLDPNAPKVDYMDDFAAGEYTGDSYVVGYFDSNDDGEPDTRITDSTTVQYNGTVTEDGDFIDSFEVDETSGNASTKDVEFFVVARYGQAKIRKRNTAGQGQTLKGEDMIRYAFASPYDPNTDRQVKWDRDAQGLKGVIPPKFKLDVVYFDTSQSVHVDAANADNLQVHIPVNQRPVRPEENPKDLRRRVTDAMAGRH